MKTFPHHSLLCKKYIDGKSQAAISVINKGFLSGTLTKICLLGLVLGVFVEESKQLVWEKFNSYNIFTIFKNGLPYMQKLS